MTERSIDEMPAFPSVFSDDSNHLGMSLRDYFAAAALTGILSNPTFAEAFANGKRMGITPHHLAFEQADAMILAWGK